MNIIIRMIHLDIFSDTFMSIIFISALANSFCNFFTAKTNIYSLIFCLLSIYVIYKLQHIHIYKNVKFIFYVDFLKHFTVYFSLVAFYYPYTCERFLK